MICTESFFRIRHKQEAIAKDCREIEIFWDGFCFYRLIFRQPENVVA